MITCAVEGDTDVPFVTRLCEASGFEVNPPIISGKGKDGLKSYIAGFAKASAGAPHLIVRDLDQDASCAADWIRAEGPRTAGKYFSLRLAVRAVEAWFLADVKHAAKCLHVKPTALPANPDDEADPKLTIVALARQSTKPAVKTAIVPPQHWSRKTAAGYTGWFLDAAAGWSFSVAVQRSPSLARAHERLKVLCAAWNASTG